MIFSYGKVDMNKRELHFYKKAKKISRISTYDRIRIGCVAVYKKNIIGVGYNQAKTNPMQAKYNIYRKTHSPNDVIHAEMACINQIKNLDIDFTKVKLYVYREDENKHKRICKPCEACERAIRDLGIKTVYYTDTDSYVKECYN